MEQSPHDGAQVTAHWRQAGSAVVGAKQRRRARLCRPLQAGSPNASQHLLHPVTTQWVMVAGGQRGKGRGAG
jgi:hypothetical protein